MKSNHHLVRYRRPSCCHLFRISVNFFYHNKARSPSSVGWQDGWWITIVYLSKVSHSIYFAVTRRLLFPLLNLSIHYVFHFFCFFPNKKQKASQGYYLWSLFVLLPKTTPTPLCHIYSPGLPSLPFLFVFNVNGMERETKNQFNHLEKAKRHSM